MYLLQVYLSKIVHFHCFQFIHQLDGKYSLNENICDNVGAKVSYLAYQKWMNDNGAELKLPGLSFTSQQLFWLSLAQNFCAVYRKGKLFSILQIR